MQDTMTRQEELECIFWDMYKDAYGIRPRGISTHLWDEAKFIREFDFLQSEITKNEGLRKIAEHQAAVDFENRVTNLMHTGTSRERVIAWLMDAESANGDFEYFCFTQGLPYQYFRKVA